MSEIIFSINGKQYRVDGNHGDISLNDFLRSTADLRGTKVMCQEGGCGACVVSVRARDSEDKMKTFAVNSCLVSVLSCHGWEVTTVEGLGGRTRGYHEIQSRLATYNGTQCGYCSPGWVMNMHSLLESKSGKVTKKEVENSFGGNICRCTGYRPIADAFKSFAIDADKINDIEDIAKIPCIINESCPKIAENIENNDNDWFLVDKQEMIEIKSDNRVWIRATNLEQVFKAMKMGDYRLVAGNTGHGVIPITSYPTYSIDIRNVTELQGYSVDMNLILMAGMSLTNTMAVFQRLSNENEDFKYLKDLYDHMDLVAHVPVRNIGTLGGNLSLKHQNNAFPSDLFLLFETVGAMITIAGDVNNKITITLPEFLKSDMKAKVIVNIILPPLSQCCHLKTFKIMPRAQNAHAVVNAGFLFQFQYGSSLLAAATIVYGGLSPNFIHAGKTEALLVGKDPYADDTLVIALQSLSGELVVDEAPPEPSVEYRKKLAISLFYKAIISLSPEDRVNPIYRSGGEIFKRSVSKGVQIFDTDESVWPLNQPVSKLEALAQCSGEAIFVNDLPTQINEVFAAFVTADVTPGSIIKGFDTSAAFEIPEVLAFYSSKDIPGENTFTPENVPFMSAKEEMLCSETVKYFGQPAGIIVAENSKVANDAAALVKILYSSISTKKPLITIDDVLNSPEKDSRVVIDQTIEPTDVGGDVKRVIKGEYRCEGQYHFTMETQTCVVVPSEDGLDVYSSTQWIDLAGVAISRSLKIPINSVNVMVRRLGGAYGSKISRAIQVACAAALVTHKLGRTCRFAMTIKANMKIFGKRLPLLSKFEVGVNSEGEIQYLKNVFYSDAGCSFNEKITVLTILDIPNCYDARRWYYQANSVVTDTASNTWCRAPGSTEAIAMTEYIMEKIANELGKDPIEVRLINMKKENNPVPDMIKELKDIAAYEKRLGEINIFNQGNRWRKRSLKLIPMTTDIIYLGNYNSLISIYHGDGSVVVTHGGIEMGQGINTKVAQACAYALNIPLDKVSIKPSVNITSPNCITTGGSVGSECVVYATVKACEELVERLKPIKDGLKNPTWEAVIDKAYNANVNLQAAFLYTTNDGNVKPYSVYGVCGLEVEVDILTGSHDVRRVDLLEDTGRSLSPQIDIGQIEGAFIMGLGYWTSEKLVYDINTGKLLTDRSWTYKPPGIKDIPADMRIYFRRNTLNEFGVLQSKATGEPALCLAVIVTHAIRDAVQAARADLGDTHTWVHIENPCTIENIFMAVGHDIKQYTLK